MCRLASGSLRCADELERTIAGTAPKLACFIAERSWRDDGRRSRTDRPRVTLPTMSRRLIAIATTFSGHDGHDRVAD